MTATARFAAVPARAIGDQRLSGLHLRVLCAVALHDGLSSVRKSGQGCWAGNHTLATECGCHYTRLSTALGHLEKLGYIVRTRRPGRLRVYRVQYTPEDFDFINATRSLPGGKLFRRFRNVPVCPNSQKREKDHPVEEKKYIPQKREKNIPTKAAPGTKRSGVNGFIPLVEPLAAALEGLGRAVRKKNQRSPD